MFCLKINSGHENANLYFVSFRTLVPSWLISTCEWPFFEQRSSPIWVSGLLFAGKARHDVGYWDSVTCYFFGARKAGIPSVSLTEHKVIHWHYWSKQASLALVCPTPRRCWDSQVYGHTCQEPELCHTPYQVFVSCWIFCVFRSPFS